MYTKLKLAPGKLLVAFFFCLSYAFWGVWLAFVFAFLVIILSYFDCGTLGRNYRALHHFSTRWYSQMMWLHCMQKKYSSFRPKISVFMSRFSPQTQRLTELTTSVSRKINSLWFHLVLCIWFSSYVFLNPLFSNQVLNSVEYGFCH